MNIYDFVSFSLKMMCGLLLVVLIIFAAVVAGPTPL